MKRINILLSRRILLNALLCLLILGIGFPSLLLLIIGSSTPTALIALLFGCFITIALLIPIIHYRQLPLYLEFDEEKIIAHYLFGATATVWKNKTVYIGKYMVGRGGFYTLISNVPFLTEKIPMRENLCPPFSHTASHFDRHTQILIVDDEFPELSSLYPKEMCVPAEDADSDLLASLLNSAAPRLSDRKRLSLLPEYYGHLLISVLVILFIAAFHIIAFTESFILGMVFLCAFGIFWFCLLVMSIGGIIKDFRFCNIVTISNVAVTSSMFMKEQCTVDLTQNVYYAAFRGAEYNSGSKVFVAVSNTPFNYFKVNRDDRSYLSEYPMDTQVAFPYNAETAPYCDFDNWHCVGGFGELNLRQQSN